VSHTNTLVTTHPLAVTPVFSSTNPSHSYRALFLISPILNRLPLLSIFLAIRYPYLTFTALLRHPPFLNHSPFCLEDFNSFLYCYHTSQIHHYRWFQYSPWYYHRSPHFSVSISFLVFQPQSTREFSYPQQKHSDTSLAPSLSSTHCSPSDHFPVFTKLSTPLPPPTIHSYRRLHYITLTLFSPI